MTLVKALVGLLVGLVVGFIAALVPAELRAMFGYGNIEAFDATQFGKVLNLIGGLCLIGGPIIGFLMPFIHQSRAASTFMSKPDSTVDLFASRRDFRDNKTALQSAAWDEDLWRAKYAGKDVHLDGTVFSIEQKGDLIYVRVSVVYDYYQIGDDSRSHSTLVHFAVPMSQREHYLTFKEMEHVYIQGVLPQKRQYIHDFHIEQGKLLKKKA